MKLTLQTFILVFFCMSYTTSQAISVSVDNDWACSLTDTITNAGDYYASTLESDAAELNCTPSSTLLSISAVTDDTTPWTLHVKLSTSVSGLSVNLKRTGNGSGNSTPSGGEAYITLSTSEQEFFTGQGDISSIPLLFELNNLDVDDGNGSKTIAISYRVVE